MFNVQLAARLWQRPRPCVRIAASAVMIRTSRYTSRGSIAPCRLCRAKSWWMMAGVVRFGCLTKTTRTCSGIWLIGIGFSTMLPALAETLESIFGGTVHLEAKLPEHIMHMIEEGKLHFATDKNGEILAEVFDERNKIFKQVRLEKVVRNDALLPAMQHLETQAALCLVMGKIDEVGRAVQQLGEELQQDRLARVDAALDMFQQACRIESSRERNEYVREALNEATRAKALLVRNFAQQQRLMEQGGKKSDAALRAMQDYVAIVNAVNVQMQTHMALEQQDAAAYCLQDLNKFIKNYDLDKRDTMLNLVGSVKSKNRGDNPEKFVAGSLRIAANVENVAKALDAGEAISPKLITESERNGNDSNDEEKQHDEED